MPPPIEKWIVCIAGFRQEGRLSGMEVLQDALRLKCKKDDTLVLLKSWQDNMEHLAERMYNRRPIDHQPRVVIIGYSYGGYTATLLANTLATYKWDIEVMLLIDPVWRYLAWLPSFLSLLGGWKIKVTKKVLTLYSWHQEVNRPRGHKLKVDEDATYWVQQTLSVPHDSMDEEEVIHKRALALACPEVIP